MAYGSETAEICTSVSNASNGSTHSGQGAVRFIHNVHGPPSAAGIRISATLKFPSVEDDQVTHEVFPAPKELATPDGLRSVIDSGSEELAATSRSRPSAPPGAVQSSWAE